MDYYKKQKISNLILFVIFVVGVILQFVGHSQTGYPALGLQFYPFYATFSTLHLQQKTSVRSNNGRINF